MKITLLSRKSLLLACTSVLFLISVCLNANNRGGNISPLSAPPTTTDNTVFTAGVKPSGLPPANSALPVVKGSWSYGNTLNAALCGSHQTAD